jgi:hypothetical protein
MPTEVTFTLGSLFLTPETLPTLSSLLGAHQIQVQVQPSPASLRQVPAHTRTESVHDEPSRGGGFIGWFFLLCGLYFYAVVVLPAIKRPDQWGVSHTAALVGLLATTWVWLALTAVGRLSRRWTLQSELARLLVTYIVPILVVVIPFAAAQTVPMFLGTGSTAASELVPAMELSFAAGYSAVLGLSQLRPTPRR